MYLILYKIHYIETNHLKQLRNSSTFNLIIWVTYLKTRKVLQYLTFQNKGIVSSRRRLDTGGLAPLNS